MNRTALVLALFCALPVLAAGPKFEHTPPAEAVIGQDLTVTAVIKTPGGVFDPYLWHRPAGSKTFKKVPLKPAGDGSFSATIPGAEITGDLEYYLQAFDAAELSEGDWQSKKNPYKLHAKAAPAAPKTGTLMVRADPDGSSVEIDGKLMGQSPWAGPVAAGQHALTVSKEGYETLRMNFTMAAGGDMSLPVPLRRSAGGGGATTSEASGPGRVSIDTRPMGARLLVDDQGQGSAPNTLTLTPGQHKLQALLDGFQPATQTIDVQAGRMDTVRLTLQPAGDLADARARMEKKLKADPKDPGLALNLAQICEAMHENACAIEGYEAYMANAPGSPYSADAQSHLGTVRAQEQARQRENQWVDFMTDQTGEAFGVEVRTSDQLLHCDLAVQFGRSCRLNIPAGRADVTISGAMTMTKTIEVPRGHAAVKLARGASAAPVVWGILFMGGAVAGYEVLSQQKYNFGESEGGSSSATDGTGGTSKICQTQGGCPKDIPTPAIAGIVAGGALGFILFIYGVANNDEFTFRPQGESMAPTRGQKVLKSLQVGVAPMQGGFSAGASLRF